MGMDVWGRNPSSPKGRYFRANVWSWRPIHALCVELGRDLFDDETLRGMSFNIGAGPTDQEASTKLADRFDQWLEHHADGFQVDLGLRVTPEGRFVPEQDRAKEPDLETNSPYQVADEHLKEWGEFLRHCGGFEVW